MRGDRSIRWDYVTLLNHLAGLKIAGGAVYDALLLHAAWKSDVDQVVAQRT